MDSVDACAYVYMYMCVFTCVCVCTYLYKKQSNDELVAKFSILFFK